jgi:hypothetical protein
LVVATENGAAVIGQDWVFLGRIRAAYEETTHALHVASIAGVIQILLYPIPAYIAFKNVVVVEYNGSSWAWRGVESGDQGR